MVETPNFRFTGGYDVESKRRNGWETGIRTPISRVRVCCPTVERSPSTVEQLHFSSKTLAVGREMKLTQKRSSATLVACPLK